MPPAEGAVVALLIGERHYMTGLNAITTRIVERAVEIWRGRPGAVLVCEAADMAAVARNRGVPDFALRVAIPEPAGHTTRWAAERVAAMRDLADRPVTLVTHRLHGARARRIFRAAGVAAEVVGVDAPFDAGDPDWKLRSAGIFRLYNAGAWVYCFVRGWV